MTLERKILLKLIETIKKKKPDDKERQRILNIFQETVLTEKKLMSVQKDILKALSAIVKDNDASIANNEEIIKKFDALIDTFKYDKNLAEEIKKLNAQSAKAEENIGSLITTLFSEFTKFIATFFSRLTMKVMLSPEHYRIPQRVILIDEKSRKSINMKEFGTVAVRGGGPGGGGPSKVGIRGADLFGSGNATVTTAGTPVQLPDILCSRVMVQADTDNVGDIVVGGSGVDALSSPINGLRLTSNTWQEFRIKNLNLLWFDATTNGCSISYIYEQ